MSSQFSSTRTPLENDNNVNENLLRRCAIDAAEGIVGLWDKSRGTFWQSTTHRSSYESKAANEEFFPTASLRCIDALVSLIVDFPDWAGSDIRKLVRETMVPKVVTREHATLKTSLNVETQSHEQQPLNLFTLSLYVQAFSRISKLLEPRNAEVLAKLDTAADSLLKHSAFAESDGSKPLGIHPFLLYHSCRAVSNFIGLKRSNGLETRCGQLVERIAASVRRSIEQLISRQRLASLNPSECVASAFCAATLALDLKDEDWRHARAAVELCFDSQDSNGCWPLGRIVRKDKTLVNAKLEISTYEIAAIVAETLGQLADKANEHLDSGLGAESVKRLIQAEQYTERSAVRLDVASDPNVGWCTDHAYEQDEIQSWTCATVLESLLSFAKLIEESDRQNILSTLTHVSPRDADWPSWRRWDEYRVSSEIDHKHRVLQYLHEEVVEPVLASPRRLPNRTPSSVSVLLFGPPGTSKTTIVKAVADGLQWPVVLLSPGNFIEKGLEHIEAQARSVFGSLMSLSRAVVIFDECDELFRDRAPSPATEPTRGITAFVTASMLPKLQELHDRGRVVFFICTNNFETIDPAIKRGGRVDHIIGIGPPDEAARLEIAGATIGELRSWTPIAHFEAAKKRLVLKTERFTRPEIERAVRLLAQMSSWNSDADAEAEADRIADGMSESLTIGKKDYDDFVKLNTIHSHALSKGVPGHA